MSPYVAEFVANVALRGTKGEASSWIVITLEWAMTVFVTVFVVAGASGAHINPAVTLGLAMAGKVGWGLVPGYVLAQLAGAALGAALVYLHYRPHSAATEGADLKLAVFSTGPAIRRLGDNVVSEVIGTFVLVFAVLFLAAPSVAGPAGAPGGIGSLDALP